MALLQILNPLPHPLESSIELSCTQGRGRRRRRRSPTTTSAALYGGGDAINRSSVLETTSVDELWQWARQRGALPAPPVVKPGLVPEGLGLVAQQDLSRNDLVLEVPKSLWINSDTVAASEIGALCEGLSLRPWISIALFLLREKALGSSSPWRPYLRILPHSTNSPLFWSEEELREIQG